MVTSQPFALHIHGATGLASVAFGEQCPYVSCELLPNSDGERVRTAAIPDGGTAPCWDELLVLHAKQGTTKLKIELYDEGTMIDNVIGVVELELEDVCTDHPLPMKFLLDTGGKIEVTVHKELPEHLERESSLAPVLRTLYQNHPHAVRN
jgi:Ca2+-dependent lipid-binding protein